MTQNNAKRITIYTKSPLEDYKFDYDNVSNVRLVGTTLSFDYVNKFSKKYS